MPQRGTGRKRGFNAAKKGSGQVGFQPAPPIHPEVPAEIEWEEETLPLDQPDEKQSPTIDSLYGHYTTLVEEDFDESLEGLSEEEKHVVIQAKNQVAKDTDTHLSQDSIITTHSLMRVWGLNEEETTTLQQKIMSIQIEKKPGYHEYISGEDAEYELKELIEGPPFSLFGKSPELTDIFDSLKTQKIMLTRHELDTITVLRDEAYQLFLKNRSNEDSRRLEETWIPAEVNRKCEICGKFISTRDSHGALNSESLYPLQEGETRQSLTAHLCTQIQDAKAKTFVAKIVSLDGEENNFYLNSRLPLPKKKITSTDPEDFISPELHQHSLLPKGNTKFKEEILDTQNKTYSLEYLEDIYMAEPNLRTTIVSLFVEKTGFLGRDKQIVLPKNMREAIIEAPLHYTHGNGRNAIITNIAAKVEPPLEDSEIKRLIDRGDIGVLNSLLKTKRTRESTLRIISDYPSQALRQLSLTPGGLDKEMITMMSSSGDARVRAYVAGSHSTDKETILRLSEDPDPMVRRALIVPHHDPIVAGETLAPNSRYPSNVKLHPEVKETLINDPDTNIAFFLFTYEREEVMSTLSYDFERERFTRFTKQQKYLISKIRSRKRFNELKQYVIAHPQHYDPQDPNVARFLAH